MSDEAVHPHDIIRMVRTAVAEAGGVTAFARAKDISPSLVTDTLSGKRLLSHTIAATVGFMQVAYWAPRRKATTP